MMLVCEFPDGGTAGHPLHRGTWEEAVGVFTGLRLGMDPEVARGCVWRIDPDATRVPGDGGQ